MRGVGGTYRFLKGVSKLHISEIRKSNKVEEGTVIVKMHPEDGKKFKIKEGDFKVEVEPAIFDYLARAAVMAAFAESSAGVVGMVHSLLTDQKTLIACRDRWLGLRADRLMKIKDFLEEAYEQECKKGKSLEKGALEENKQMEKNVEEETDVED